MSVRTLWNSIVNHRTHTHRKLHKTYTNVSYIIIMSFRKPKSIAKKRTKLPFPNQNNKKTIPTKKKQSMETKYDYMIIENTKNEWI